MRRILSQGPGAAAAAAGPASGAGAIGRGGIGSSNAAAAAAASVPNNAAPFSRREVRPCPLPCPPSDPRPLTSQAAPACPQLAPRLGAAAPPPPFPQQQQQQQQQPDDFDELMMDTDVPNVSRISHVSGPSLPPSQGGSPFKYHSNDLYGADLDQRAPLLPAGGGGRAGAAGIYTAHVQRCGGRGPGALLACHSVVAYPAGLNVPQFLIPFPFRLCGGCRAVPMAREVPPLEPTFPHAGDLVGRHVAAAAAGPRAGQQQQQGPAPFTPSWLFERR